MNTNQIVNDHLFPVSINAMQVQWGIAGGGMDAFEKLTLLLDDYPQLSITLMASAINDHIKKLAAVHENVNLLEKDFDFRDISNAGLLIVATGNEILDEKIQAEAQLHNKLVFVADDLLSSDFVFPVKTIQHAPAETVIKKRTFQGFQSNSEQSWRRLTSKIILAFLLMVLGHIIISYLPMPSFNQIITNVRPYFNYQFVFFVLAGFLAQMVDGTLGMGYGVTSATCLMSFGIHPVSVSAAIHTSEIFTTATSGYSHYKFGNVNKKMFKHLVIPGVIGAILGAVMLVYLGEKYGKWLMPVIALYAMFLGLKILIRAFQKQTKNKKIRRLGWLAGVGGFLDSFGGGGWGPIVTSSLIAKGRSPRFTIGTVNLAEFFITVASAFTFFITVGVSHWNVVLGLLIGGGAASPIAARMAGRLPRKTMMILVGIMVMIWCGRMIVKSL